MKAERHVIFTDKVMSPDNHPALKSGGAALRPFYSQAIRTPRLLFVGGIVATEGQSSSIPDPTMEGQTRQVIENMREILGEAGLTLRDVVRVVVFIRDRAEFQKMNRAYVEYFSEAPPTRTCSTVADMYAGARVAMSAIASYEPVTPISTHFVGAPNEHPALTELPANERKSFFSQALRTPSFLFLNGVVGTEVGTNVITEKTTEGQTTKALENLDRTLRAGDLRANDVVTILTLLQNQEDSTRMHGICSEYFSDYLPPRCCVTEGEHFPNSKLEFFGIASYDPKKKVVLEATADQVVEAHAVKTHELIFVTGVVGVDEGASDTTIEVQTARAMERLGSILHAAGASLADVVSTTIFLRTRDDFEAMSQVYSSYFPSDPPALSCAAMFDLRDGAKVEIFAVASCTA